MSWGIASEGERGCGKLGKSRGGEEVVMEGMSSGRWMVVEDEGECSGELGEMREGGAEDAAIREGGREGGILTHEESRGRGGGALDRCRCARGGYERPCFWERGMDTGNDKMGVLKAEDAEL